MTLGMMINGQWQTAWTERGQDGSFKRMKTQFRRQITTKPEAGRYHLYVSLGCPWAHRTVITRSLLGLDRAISMSIVEPEIGAQGWRFSNQLPDHLYGSNLLSEIYLRSDDLYTGRITVPILWDKKTQKVVNNESRDLINMFDSVFRPLATRSFQLFPAPIKKQIDAMIDANYESINNGVYKVGFATTQAAYDRAIDGLYRRLDQLDRHLSTRLTLVGQQWTAADICLFVTLIRFDLAYQTAFKINRKRLADYPHLQSYMEHMLGIDAVASTIDVAHIKRLYYRIEAINPSGVIAEGPRLPWINRLIRQNAGYRTLVHSG